jgi:hypothetical protein
MKILVAVTAVVVAVVAVSAAVGAIALGSDSGSDRAQQAADKTMPAGTVRRGKPQIMPVGGLALAIKGTGFVPGENVRVTISEAGPQMTRKVKAGRLGGFLVRFAGGFDRCRGMTVRAVGDRGSKTGFQLSSVMCAVPGQSQ